MPKLLAVLLLLVMSVLPAAAQLPAPPEGATFMDPDPAAGAVFLDLDNERGVAKLERHLEKNPEDPRGWHASAYRHSVARNSGQALADLEKARALVGWSERSRRELLWSEGWINLNLGNYPAATAAWIEAANTHGGQPHWVPSSYALLSELVGDRKTALAWFALAAHNHPKVWDTRSGLLQYTRFWHQREREAALRLFEAHSAARDGDT